MMANRNMANKVLATVLLLFVLISGVKYFYKNIFVIELLHFVTEAALVGGIADWFAVTALFRKPLGFPWHTELIARHRGRVINAVADMIENELLSVESIKSRVDKVCFVDVLIAWVENKNGKQFLKKILSKHSDELMAGIELETFAVYLDRMIKNKVSQIELVPYIKTASKWAVKQKKDEQLLSYIVDECINIVQATNTRQVIYQQLVQIRDKKTKSIIERALFWLGEQTDSVNLHEASDAIYEELIAMLYEAKQPDHILYKWVHAKLLEIIVQLYNQDLWMENIAEWKQAIVMQVDMTKSVLQVLEIAMETAKESSESPIRVWLLAQLDNYWQGFTQNKQAQEWLETGIKKAIYKLIENEQQLVGIIVRKVLHTFSDEDLTRFIEDKAGDDLQWIRINGSVVGAVVGLGLFLFLQVIYNPFIVPVVQGVFK